MFKSKKKYSLYGLLWFYYTSTIVGYRMPNPLYIYIYIYANFIKHNRHFLTDKTTILDHQNYKQKLQILEALYIRHLQPALNRINFQTSANVLKCL